MEENCTLEEFREVISLIAGKIVKIGKEAEGLVSEEYLSDLEEIARGEIESHFNIRSISTEDVSMSRIDPQSPTAKALMLLMGRLQAEGVVGFLKGG